jgi:metallo-beta-lactamase class B
MREAGNQRKHDLRRHGEKRRMKIGFVIIIMGCALLLHPIAASAQPRVAAQLMEDLFVFELQQNVLLVRHSFPWPANSLLVKVSAVDWVWADTPYTPEATRLVVKWMYTKYGERIRLTEINTGFHIDNLGGNKELLKWKIPIYGSSLTCQLLKTNSKGTMAKMLGWLGGPENKKYLDTYQSFVFYEPTKRFDINKIKILRLGGATVEIFYPGPTHTSDNVVVYFTGKKILFGTCMVLARNATSPGYIDDGDIREWPQSLRRVRKRYGRAVLVVPGHGEPGDLTLIDHSISILERFTKQNKEK